MKCRNCGQEITDNSKFCTYCGAKVEPLSIDENLCINQNTTSTIPVQRKKRKKIFLFLGIAIILFVIVDIILFNVFFKSKRNILTTHIWIITRESEDYDENEYIDRFVFNSDGTCMRRELYEKGSSYEEYEGKWTINDNELTIDMDESKRFVLNYKELQEKDIENDIFNLANSEFYVSDNYFIMPYGTFHSASKDEEIRFNQYMDGRHEYENGDDDYFYDYNKYPEDDDNEYDDDVSYEDE